MSTQWYSKYTMLILNLHCLQPTPSTTLSEQCQTHHQTLLILHSVAPSQPEFQVVNPSIDNNHPLSHLGKSSKGRGCRKWWRCWGDEEDGCLIGETLGDDVHSCYLPGPGALHCLCNWIFIMVQCDLYFSLLLLLFYSSHLYFYLIIFFWFLLWSHYHCDIADCAMSFFCCLLMMGSTTSFLLYSLSSHIVFTVHNDA